MHLQFNTFSNQKNTFETACRAHFEKRLCSMCTVKDAMLS